MLLYYPPFLMPTSTSKSSLDPPIPPCRSAEALSRQWMGQLAACVVDPVAWTEKGRENPEIHGEDHRNMITIVT